MLARPRVVIIDDNRIHLDALASGLHQRSLSCLPIFFPDELSHLGRCPNLRVLFADLHLIEGGNSSDNTIHFNTLGSLIQDTIKPLGPYFVVLWTMYPDEADELLRHLERELEGVATPFEVAALDKSVYYSADDVLDNDRLVKDIAGLSKKSPQLSALLNWEDRVLGAAGDTVVSVLELAKREQDREARKLNVSKLLYRLAAAAVGEQHVETGRFRAVNEALLPVLADRLAFLESGPEDTVWENAFDPRVHNQNLSHEEVSKLNRMVHIAPPSDISAGNERGAVVKLPERFRGSQFKQQFTFGEEELARAEFFCRASQMSQCRWLLVQAQPACDYALNRPGTLPFYLGHELPAEIEGNSRPRESLWRSPRYEYDGVERLLHVSARFPVSISGNEAMGMKLVYRLREQLLESLIHHLHSYGSRLGIISFR